MPMRLPQLSTSALGTLVFLCDHACLKIVAIMAGAQHNDANAAIRTHTRVWNRGQQVSPLKLEEPRPNAFQANGFERADDAS